MCRELRHLVVNFISHIAPFTIAVCAVPCVILNLLHEPMLLVNSQTLSSSKVLKGTKKIEDRCWMKISILSFLLIVCFQAMRRWPLRTGAHQGNNWRNWPAWLTSSLLRQVATPGQSHSFHNWSITCYLFFFFFILVLYIKVWLFNCSFMNLFLGKQIVWDLMHMTSVICLYCNSWIENKGGGDGNFWFIHLK